VILRLKENLYELRGEPLVMGIVNIGDDSVADGVHLRTLEEQLRHARGQLDQGAHMLDIGVQSGRTDTAMISERDELERLLPLVGALAGDGVPISVETWRPAVAERAVQAGASLINDVSGLADIGVADVAAETGAGLVVMHTRARPKEERFPAYTDPVSDVLHFLRTRCDAAIQAGVDASQLIADPGLDFTKTPTESVEVLRRLSELHALGRPLLLAVSRKYFVGMLTAKVPEDRLAGTLAALDYGVSQGACILRVHDVGAVTEYLHVRKVLLDSGEPELRGDPRSQALKWIKPKSA
jgi:dihydropteroate synthase